MAWTISGKKIEATRAALSDLSAHVEDLEAEYDEHSERWLESAKGETVREWLDEATGLIEDATSALDDLEELDRP